MQALYFGANEKSPQIGDTKISFEKIILPEVSSVGMQSGDGLTHYTTQTGNTLFLLAAGREPSPKMCADLTANTTALTWASRL